MIRKTASFVAAAILSCSAAAQEEAQDTAAPPLPPLACTGAPYHDFAFWIGDWDVYAGGQLAGHNGITEEEGGCLLVERWESAQGTTGQSYNFYDPLTQQWRQLWVSLGNTIDYTGGLDDEGRMVLTGTIAYRSNNSTADFRGTWTDNGDGTVTQHFEQFDGETGEWTDWFIGLYVPAGTEPPWPEDEE